MSPAHPRFVLALLKPLTVQADIVVGGIGVPEGEAYPISVFTSVAQGALFSDGSRLSRSDVFLSKRIRLSRRIA